MANSKTLKLCVCMCVRALCAFVGVQLKGETDFLVESIKSPSNKQRLPQVVPKATAIPQTNPKTQPHTHHRDKRGEGEKTDSTISVEQHLNAH